MYLCHGYAVSQAHGNTQRGPKRKEIKESIDGRLFLHKSNKGKIDLRETKKNGPPPRKGVGSIGGA